MMTKDLMPEALSPEAMVLLIRELQSQNQELQCSQAELAEALRTKEALLEKANALLENRQVLPPPTTHDPLTGLLKHRAALTVLSKDLARCKRHGEELAIGLCTIDTFKEITDTWGRQAGNEVLCQVARTLTASLREYDTVARLRREEFLLIMPLKPGMEALSACERLCGQIAGSKVNTIRGELSIAISIGLAYAAAGSIIKELWSEADAALSQAKKQGGNRVVYFVKA